MAFPPSYSCPVECVANCYESPVPLHQQQSTGALLSKSELRQSQFNIDIPSTPKASVTSLLADLIPLTLKCDQIQFPVSDFEDFYLNNLPSAKFHHDGDAFDFRSLVTETESCLSRFYEKGLPSKIVEVITAYRDTVHFDDDSKTAGDLNVDQNVVYEIELCLGKHSSMRTHQHPTSMDTMDISTMDISMDIMDLYAEKAVKTLTKSSMDIMDLYAEKAVKTLTKSIKEIQFDPNEPQPTPLYTSKSHASYFVANPNRSRRAAKVARFAAMRIRSILSLQLGLMELIEHQVVLRLMTDQYGSRYLQNLIRSLKHDACRKMVTVLLHHLMDINADLVGMCEDVYGNYLIQLFFARGSDEHHELLLNHVIYPSLLRLSRSKYGCRVVQKVFSSIKNVERAIDILKSETKNEPRRSNNSLHHCLICCNTNHVIQKMIELKQPYESVEFIKVALEKDLVAYSENVFACRVVQSFVTVYGDKLDVHKLFEDSAHLFLSRVKYGNYVIQCIVKQDQWYSNLPSIVNFRNKLISDVFQERNLLFLSKDKHASNVIETCVKVANERQLQPLIQMVCSKQGFLLRNLMSDRYGNYVPRTLLQYCSRNQKKMLVNTVHLYITNLNEYEYDNRYHQSVKFMAEVKYAMDHEP